MKYVVLSKTSQSIKLRFQLTPAESQFPGCETLSPLERQQRLMQKAFQQYLKSESVEVARPPQFKLLSESSLGLNFTCELELYPEVKLPPSLSLQLDITALEAPKAIEIEQAVQSLQIQLGEQKKVDRPAQWGDVLQIQTLATCLGQYLPESAHSNLSVVLDPARQKDPFLSCLIGLSAGQQTQIIQPLDETFIYAPWRGKPVRYLLQIQEVQSLRIPPVKDLPALIGEASCEDLLDHLYSALAKVKAEVWQTQVCKRLAQELIRQSQLTLPPTWIDGELNMRWKQEIPQLNALKDFPLAQEILKKGVMNYKLLPYLQAEAAQTLKIRLVLRAIARQEQISFQGNELLFCLQQLVPNQPVEGILERLRETPELSVMLDNWLLEKTLRQLVKRARLRVNGQPLQIVIA